MALISFGLKASDCNNYQPFVYHIQNILQEPPSNMRQMICKVFVSHPHITIHSGQYCFDVVSLNHIKVLDLFTPEEYANYLASCGYINK